MRNGRNTSEFRSFSCKNFRLSFSTFVDVFSNCNSLCKDVNTVQNWMSEIKEDCCCWKIRSVGCLQLCEQWTVVAGAGMTWRVCLCNFLSSGISLFVAHKWQWCWKTIINLFFQSNTTIFYYLTSVKPLVIITEVLTEFWHWCKFHGIPYDIEFNVHYM